MTALIAVYRDRETADAAVHELSAEQGIPATSMRTGDEADMQASIRAEMDAEVAEGWGSPGMGAFVTAEMMRGALLFIVILGGVGLFVGLGLGYLLYGSGEVWTRLGVGALVGALFGATVGGLLGGGLAMKSPEEKLAAERGVAVALDPASPAAEEVLAKYEPIRIDKFEDGMRVSTPVTEGPDGLTESVAEFVANAEDPKRQG